MNLLTDQTKTKIKRVLKNFLKIFVPLAVVLICFRAWHVGTLQLVTEIFGLFLLTFVAMIIGYVVVVILTGIGVFIAWLYFED